MGTRLDDATMVRGLIARAWLSKREVDVTLGGVTLAPHQRDAAARLLDTIDEFGGALLADDVGMGKTYTALAVARCFSSLLVVAPASLRAMWLDALSRAGVSGSFASYESLSRGASAPVTPAIVIADEVHHARNARTRRYHALATSTFGARVLLLSATPIHNRLRELRAPLALFLGSSAYSLGAAELSRLIVRRRYAAMPNAVTVPAISAGHCLTVPTARAVLRAVTAISPPVPPSDGGVAGALVQLGLLRAWSSSHAALRRALRGRAHRALAMAESLQAGRLPSRIALAAWTTVDDAVQLAFPELVAPRDGSFDAPALLEALDAHASGVRHALRALDEAPDADRARAAHISTLRDRHAGVRMVVFTQFASTAQCLFEQLCHLGGVALVTGDSARIASGPVSRDEVVAQFGPRGVQVPARLRVDLLIATDVLSEGLNLQDAGVVVHLDFPWTPARLEQRLGRLRRLGSPHAHIYSYFIGPKLDTRDLAGVVRTLHRKARLVESAFGWFDALGQAPFTTVGARLPNDDDLTGQAETLRRVLSRWAEAAPHGDVHGPWLRQAVVRSRELDHAWLSIALARSRTRVHIAALTPDAASERPRDVLVAAQLIDAAEGEWCSERDQHLATPRSGNVSTSDNLTLDAKAHEHTSGVQDANEAAAAWLNQLRARELAAPTTDAPSPAHTAALRSVDRLLSDAPRHARARLRPLVAQCRNLVLSARGAGAELALAEWSSTAKQPTSEQHVRTLISTLESRVALTPGTGTAEPRLLALLLLERGGA